MKSALAERVVESSPPLSEAPLTLSHDAVDIAFLFNILRNSLYGNKELAVLREYSGNAWDEHREAGIPDRPISVVMPTALDPILRIRDYGRGLCEADIYGVYLTYLKSTKRNTNEAVGFMGLGSKSGFAYSDTFTITSHHGGEKSIYVVVIDESNVGKAMKLHIEPTDETGIEIAIAVQAKHIPKFEKEAHALFRWFRPLPDIVGIELKPPKHRWVGKHGAWNGRFAGIRSRAGGDDYYTDVNMGTWVVVMGCVPYQIDLEQVAPVDKEAPTEDDLSKGEMDFLRHHGGALYFDIGEIRISASRESLEYTSDMVVKLKDKVRALIKEKRDLVLAALDDEATSLWRRFRVAWDFTLYSGLKLPETHGHFRRSEVQLFQGPTTDKEGNVLDLGDSPKAFAWKRSVYYKRSRGFRRLADATMVDLRAPGILIKDNRKALRNYLTGTDNNFMVAVPLGDHTADEVEAELLEYLGKVGLTDIPIDRFTRIDAPDVAEAPEEQETRVASGWTDPKHKVNCFVLVEGDLTTHSPLSKNWNIVDRVPDEGDIFVVISRFNASGYGHGTGSLYKRIRFVRSMWEFLDEPFPTIYAYKDTVKSRVFAEDVEGTEFQAWYKGRLAELLQTRPDIKTLSDAWAWARVFDGIYGVRHNPVVVQRALVEMGNLNGRHRLVRLINQHLAGRGILRQRLSSNKDKRKKQEGLVKSIARLLGSNNAPMRALTRIYKKYPLLDPANRGPDLDIFQDDGKDRYSGNKPDPRPPWFAYIHLTDEVSK